GGQEKKVDLAHEALITGWRQLREWVKERRGAEQTRRRLENKADEWIRLQHKGGLLDEFELAEAEQWLRSAEALDLGHSPALGAFVDESHKALTESRERDRRIQDELREALHKERQSSYFANLALAERYWTS